MHRHQLSGRGWIAQPRSGVIPEGDVLPSTHTRQGATPDRMVGVNVNRRDPLPFGAINLPAVPTVVTMLLVAVTLGAAEVAWLLADHPARWLIVSGFVGVIALEVLAMTVVAVVKTKARTRPTTGDGSDGRIGATASRETPQQRGTKQEWRGNGR